MVADFGGNFDQALASHSDSSSFDAFAQDPAEKVVHPSELVEGVPSPASAEVTSSAVETSPTVEQDVGQAAASEYVVACSEEVVEISGPSEQVTTAGEQLWAAFGAAWRVEAACALALGQCSVADTFAEIEAR